MSERNCAARSALVALSLIVVFTPTVAAVDFNLRTNIVIEDLMVGNIDVSPDGRMMVISGTEGAADLKRGTMSISASGGIVVVEIPSMKVKKVLAKGTWPGDVSFSSDGSRVAGIIDGRFRIWNLKGKKLADLGEASDAAFTPDRSTALVKMDNGSLQVVSIATGKSIASAGAAGQGKPVIARPDTWWMMEAANGELTIRSSGESRNLGAWGGSDVSVAAVDDSGTRVAIGAGGGEVAVFNVVDGTELGRKHVTKSRINAIRFLPGGRSVVYVGVEGAWLWTFEGSPAHYALEGHRFPATSIGSTPDGRVIATSSMDGLRLFDVVGSLEPEPADEESQDSPESENQGR